jgi:hypothetical protein
MEEYVEDKNELTQTEVAGILECADEARWNGLDQWNDGFDWEVQYGFEA